MLIILSLVIFTSSYASANYELESVIYDYEKEEYLESQAADDVEEIDSESIEHSAASTIDDLLKMSLGATTIRGPRATGQGIQIRGLDANKTAISLDGVRQNFRSGHSSSTTVDLENLKKVKVFKGTSDISQSGSLGGGVLFVTKDVDDYLKRGQKLGSEFKFQNNGVNSETIYNAKTIFREKKLSGYLSLTSNNASNIKTGDGQELENSRFERFTTFSKFAYEKFKLSHEFSLQKDNNPADPSLDPPELAEQLSLHADSKRTKNSFNLEFQDKSVKANLYYTSYEERKVRRSSSLAETRSLFTTGLNLEKKLKNWTMGLESYQDRLRGETEREISLGYPTATGLVASAYALTNYKWGRFILTPGLRASGYTMSADEADFENKSGSFLAKSLLLAHKTHSNLELRASYSEGFNAPRVSEVYPSGLHARGDGFLINDNFFTSNPDLTHETSQMLEVGFTSNILNRNEELLTLKGSLYQNQIRNYIGLEQIDRPGGINEPVGTTQFVNRSKVRLRGGELSLQYLYDRFDMSISYTHVRGQDLSQDLYLEDLPADQIQYSFKYYLDEYQLVLGYLGSQVQAQNLVNEGTFQRTDPTPRYFVHSVYFNKAFKRNWVLNTRVDNFGDLEYRRHGSHLNAAGQDIRVSVKYKINTI